MILLINQSNENHSNNELETLTKYLKYDKRYSTLLQKCQEKSNELKQQFFWNHLSVYDVFNMKFETLANLMINPKFRNTCLTFQFSREPNQLIEVFEIIIREKVLLADERRTFFDTISIFLQKIIIPVLKKINHSSLPEPIMSGIVSYLNARDLRRLACTTKS